MSPVVARWEWRTFGERFGAAAGVLAELDCERVQESDELYLLSRRSNASVKVRGGLLDLKELQRVSTEGLEQWLPVLKAPFPLPAVELGSVLRALGVDATALARSRYTLDELVEELVRPNPDLLAVPVQKRRQHYLLDACMVELTDVRVEGRATRTIAVESADPAQVLATVGSFGLGSRRNVNLPSGIKALIGFGAKRYAVLDVGTNSVKFHVGERRADGEWSTIVDRAEVTRLGDGLAAGGRLGEEPIARTVEAIAAMADEAHRNGVAGIAAVGTAGLRLAPNRQSFVDAVRGRTGVTVEVITGEEEARLAYLAAQAELQPVAGSLVVFDTGGGSSQFTFGRGGRVDERFSVDVGAVRLTERYGLEGIVAEEVIASTVDAIAVDLAALDGRPTPDALVGMGGAVTNLAAVKHGLATYDPDVVQGTVLDRLEIDRQIELYRAHTAEQRRQIVGLQPRRAEVILAGACIVRTVLDKLGSQSLTVSDRGLRHGLLVERFGRQDEPAPV